MTARSAAGSVMRIARPVGRRAPRIIRHPGSAMAELALAALEASHPFTPGVSTLTGFPVRFTHPHSFLAQYEAIFRNEAYACRPGRPDPVIFDCGANIGLASIYWLSRYPGARITCFEPDPSIAAVLRDNLEAARAHFGLERVGEKPDTTTPEHVPSTSIGSVRVVEAALWIETGSKSFTEQGAGAGHLGGGGRVVPTVRLSDYLEAHATSAGGRVDLLKVDIEGAEVDVLTDCEPWLGFVDALFVEFHSSAGRPQRFDELVGILTRAGFRLALETEFAPRHPFVAREVHEGFDLQLNVYAYREPSS